MDDSFGSLVDWSQFKPYQYCANLAIKQEVYPPGTVVFGVYSSRKLSWILMLLYLDNQIEILHLIVHEQNVLKEDIMIGRGIFIRLNMHELNGHS
jgi:hypothetical protein